eukprot:CAMPEP_0171838348 /NCGR_PEP_ID=MMETSP0992-20121227/12708_1 /TAXON_ID=483369 /ORGANISM="non described non described, Strain CCMP2098" /LENGTH=239 /DNA_ID=CAMNT_0012454711 /DNA_START=74 /DNA_END=793 /DNA_ORIENTATION=+
MEADSSSFASSHHLSIESGSHPQSHCRDADKELLMSFVRRRNIQIKPLVEVDAEGFILFERLKIASSPDDVSCSPSKFRLECIRPIARSTTFGEIEESLHVNWNAVGSNSWDVDSDSEEEEQRPSDSSTFSASNWKISSRPIARSTTFGEIEDSLHVNWNAVGSNSLVVDSGSENEEDKHLDSSAMGASNWKISSKRRSSIAAHYDKPPSIHGSCSSLLASHTPDTEIVSQNCVVGFGS